MKEHIEIVLRSAFVSTASGPHGRDGQYQVWQKMQHAIEDIQRRLGGEERDVLRGLGERIDELDEKLTERVDELDAKRTERMDELDAKLTDLLAPDDGVMGRLDVLVAMLMTVRGDQVDTPRHACLLPGNYAQPHGLSDELRRPEVWKKNVEEWRESGFEAGKTVWKKQMRLFLICAHTHQLVPCGHNGRGYDIQRVREWVRMTVDVAQFALQVTLASLATGVVAQLPAITLGGVGEQAVEAASASLSGTLGGLTLRDDNDEAAEVLRGEVNACCGLNKNGW